MQAWQIWTWQFKFGAHPVVIISNPERVNRKDDVVILSCSSQQARRPPEIFEVILDQEDGLTWPTLCRCDLLYTVAKRDLTHHRGLVAFNRRRAIAERVVRSLAFAGL